ncbi:MAG: hypothetical protein ABIP03_11850 [Aquihabitans sp.]
MITGVLLAGVGAVLYGIGSILQAVGVRQSSIRGRGVIGALLQSAYVAGLGCDLGAWIFSLFALRRLPVFVVQAVLAGSLAVTAVLAAVTIGTALDRTDWFAVVAAVGALAVISAAGGPERASAPSTATGIVLVGGVFVVAVAVFAASEWASAPVLAGLAGVAYGGAALATRVVPTASHLTGYLGEPLAWAVVGFALVGTYGYTSSLERGDVGVVTAALWVVELVVPGLIGVLLLGDHLRAGWAIPALVASAVAVGATIALARSTSAIADVPMPDVSIPTAVALSGSAQRGGRTP